MHEKDTYNVNVMSREYNNTISIYCLRTTKIHIKDPDTKKLNSLTYFLRNVLSVGISLY
jgi:hypothetical protein